MSPSSDSSVRTYLQRFSVAAVLFGSTLLPTSADEVVRTQVPALSEQSSPFLGSFLETASPFSWFPMRVGPLLVTPHAYYRFVHADGLQSFPGVETGTNIHIISPGVLFEWGENWDLDYTPSWTYYSNPTFRDFVGQSLRLTGRENLGDWHFEVSHQYSLTSTPLTETGQQTKQHYHSTALEGGRTIGSKLRLDAVLAQSIRDTENFEDYTQRSIDGWLHYQVLPWLNTSAGVGYGRLNMQTSADSTFSRYRGRISILPSDRLSFTLTGGFEDREIEGSNMKNPSNPVYGVESNYRLTETTQISVRADRGTHASYFTNELSHNTRWQATVSQRLLERFVLSVAATRQKVEFESTVRGVPSPREDRGTVYNIQLSTFVRSRASVSLFYTRFRNNSSVDDFSFTSDQYGAEVSYHF